MLGSGIRRFDGEALGGRRLARTPPRRVTRWLAASTTAPPAPEAIGVLSSAGDDSRPITFLDRKIAAWLFRRCPRPVEGSIMPDSYVSSMGSAFYRDRITTNCGPRW